MKRVLCFLLVLLLLGASLVTVTGVALVKESDNVTFTVIDEWGDRRNLQGVTADMEFTHNEKLNWSVEFTPLGETKTEYEYNTIVSNKGEAYRLYGITNANYNLLDLKNDNWQLKSDIEALKDEAVNDGDIRTMTFRMKDYFEYYPVNFNFSVDEMSVSWYTAMGYDDVGSYSFSGISYSRGNSFLQAMRDFLKIPVHEDDVREIRIHRHEGGTYSYGGAYSGSFDFDFYNAVFSDMIYFTFRNEIAKHDQGEEKRVVDTSLIPGGYGIYALPLTENDVKYEEMKTVYSIPASATVRALMKNEERNELYLALHENGKYVLHVIDIATMTDISVIELFDFHEDGYVHVNQYEDFLVFIKNSVDFNVVKRTEDGKYESALTGAMPPEIIADRDYFSGNSRFAFDGERLVVLVIEDSGYEEISILSIQPDVMVFTKDGLQYYCKWLCSLGEPAVHWPQFVYKKSDSVRINNTEK